MLSVHFVSCAQIKDDVWHIQRHTYLDSGGSLHHCLIYNTLTKVWHVQSTAAWKELTDHCSNNTLATVPFNPLPPCTKTKFISLCRYVQAQRWAVRMIEHCLCRNKSTGFVSQHYKFSKIALQSVFESQTGNKKLRHLCASKSSDTDTVNIHINMLIQHTWQACFTAEQSDRPCF